VLGMPELETFDVKGAIAMLGSAALGASGESSARYVQGFQKMLQGRVIEGAQDVAPRFARDAIKAGRQYSGGVTDAGGKQIGPQLSLGEAALQGFGIQPSRVSEFYEGRAAVRDAKQAVADDRSELRRAWLEAEPRDRGAVMVQINRFNQAHPLQRITQSQLYRELRQREKDKTREGGYGLRLSNKQAREFGQEGRFAAY